MENPSDEQHQSSALPKKCAELRTAVSGFVSSFPTGGTVTSHISAMTQISRELEEAWQSYCSLSDDGEIRRMHSRMRARMEFLRSHMRDSVSSCGQNPQRLERYRSAHEYVARKIEELGECVPKTARHAAPPADEAPAQVSGGSSGDLRTKEDPPPVQQHSFMKAVSELKVACTNFVQTYPGDRGSVVGYVENIAGLLMRQLEIIWRKYQQDSGPSQVRGAYKMLRVECGNIMSYLKMAREICSHNNADGIYSENLSYVERKASAMMESFPAECRTVLEKPRRTIVMVEARTPRRRRSPETAGGRR